MIENIKLDDIITTEIAARELKIATANYTEADASYREAMFKCDKLRRFRQDYVDRFNSEMKDFVTEDVQQGFRSFFSRLDMVIMEQQEVVEQERTQLRIKRQLWQECQKRMELIVMESEQADLALAN